MSLLFFDGFQDANSMPKPEWNGPLNSWTMGTGRDGTPNGAAPVRNQTTVCTFSTPGGTTLIAGMACDQPQIGNTNIYWGFQIGGVTQIVVWVNSTGHIEVRRGTNTSGTLLLTSSGHAGIPANAWNHIQMKVTAANTATGSVTVALNGVVVGTVSGVQTTSSAGMFSSFMINGDTAVPHFDDLYICDTIDATSTQGRPNNDFLGDLRVAVLFPNGAGDSAQWTPSTGTNNYAVVGENPVNTTDYVSSSTSGQKDLYALTDPAGSVATVLGVRAGLFATKSDAGNVTVKADIKENGVVTSGPAATPPFGSWAGIWGSNLWKRPSDGSVWVAADLTAAQAGPELG